MSSDPGAYPGSERKCRKMHVTVTLVQPTTVHHWHTTFMTLASGIHASTLLSYLLHLPKSHSFSLLHSHLDSKSNSIAPYGATVVQTSSFATCLKRHRRHPYEHPSRHPLPQADHSHPLPCRPHPPSLTRSRNARKRRRRPRTRKRSAKRHMAMTRRGRSRASRRSRQRRVMCGRF